MRFNYKSIIHIFAILFLVFFSGAILGQSSRGGGLGPIPFSDGDGVGTTFRIWAPNATSVTVYGDFNSWSKTANPLAQETNGYWSTDVTNALVGHKFRYYINGSLERRDPRSRLVTHSNGDSIIYDPNTFDWKQDSLDMPSNNRLVIYELNINSFSDDFEGAINKLDYLHGLGVNAVELMPISEFPGNNSWGYNPSDLFAIESSYDGADGLKRFVRACHQRKMAVLVDVVHNHYGPTDLPTWQLDGWSQNGYGGIYYYNDYGICCTDWGSTRPNYGEQEVRDFIKDNTQMWLDEYHVDGFRFDSPYHITHYWNGFSDQYIPDGASLLQEINDLVDASYTGKIMIAENDDGANGFDGHWDMSFMEHIRWQVTRNSDFDRNMGALEWNLNSLSASDVIYSESHDTAGDLNDKVRLLESIDSSDPLSLGARKKSLLAMGVVMTAPGIPMFLQGQEILDTEPFTDQELSFPWGNVTTSPGQEMLSAYTELIHARRNLRSGTKGLRGSYIDVFHVDDTYKVIAYHRRESGGAGDDVVVVANFGSSVHNSGTYQFEFPASGTWYSHFNSDSAAYGTDFGNIGSSAVTASGFPPRAAVNMGSYSVQIFSQNTPAQAGSVATTPAQPNSCDPVTIDYDPGSGPLQAATNIYMVIGRNGWKDGHSISMTNQGDGTWSVTTSNLLEETEVLNFVFNNGDSTWDNNLKKDWAVGVQNCGRESKATLEFVGSGPCYDVKITYDPIGGNLEGMIPVTLHVARDGWQDLQEVTMTQTNDLWVGTVTPVEGSEQLSVAFSNGDVWDNKEGENWLFDIDGCTPNSGEVTTTPALVDSCEPVTISYEELTGVLQDAADVKVYVGLNDWGTTLGVAPIMTEVSPGVWETTVELPGEVRKILMYFSDGQGTYDNNYWKNWEFDVSNCEAVPGNVSLTPDPIEGCSYGTVTYEENTPLGKLKNASNIVMHYVDTGTSYAYQQPLEKTGASTWTTEFPVAPGSTMLKIHFEDEIGTKDANDWHYWYVAVNDCDAPTQLIITNPLADYVETESTNISLYGVLDDPLGTITYSNLHTGASATIAASSEWAFEEQLLQLGSNQLEVCGYSSTGVDAYDSATNTVYDTGWEAGANTGWNGWTLSGGADATQAIVLNSVIGARAWGLLAVNNDSSVAKRSAKTSLGIGDAFRMKWKNGGVDGSGGASIGFKYETEAEESMLELYFAGGDTTYQIKDASGIRSSDVNWNSNEMNIELELTGPTDRDYQLTITPSGSGAVVKTGQLIDQTSSSPAVFRFWNYNAGVPGQDNTNRYFLFNNLEIERGTNWIQHCDWVDIYVKPPFIDTDNDGMDDNWESVHGLSVGTNDALIDGDTDGMTNLDEYYADTDPQDPASYLLIQIQHIGGGVVQLSVPGTSADRSFQVYSTDSLLLPNWLPYDVAKDGNASTLTWTDPAGTKKYYRAKASK